MRGRGVRDSFVAIMSTEGQGLYRSFSITRTHSKLYKYTG